MVTFHSYVSLPESIWIDFSPFKRHSPSHSECVLTSLFSPLRSKHWDSSGQTTPWLGTKSFFLWLKQCHKPAMTGNGKHTTNKKSCCDDWRMVYYCCTHIIDEFPISNYFNAHLYRMSYCHVTSNGTTHPKSDFMVAFVLAPTRHVGQLIPTTFICFTSAYFRDLNNCWMDDDPKWLFYCFGSDCWRKKHQADFSSSMGH